MEFFMTHSADNFRFATEMAQTYPSPIARYVYLIAEIGINHNGDLAIAKALIDVAKNAGWDAVKFQKRTIDIVYSEDVLNAPRESPWGTTQREQKEGLEFGQAEYAEIDAYCRKVGIDWFASAWDVPSQEFLRTFNLKYNKIASAMITHLDLIEAVADEGRPTFISTGMSTYDDIDTAVRIFNKKTCPFILMHTVSEYPAPESALNLACIHSLRSRYECPVGYSGHEVTMFPSVMATMMGAVAVERHITLDRAMYGSDQSASLEKRGAELVASYIRDIPNSLGDGVKRITEVEQSVADKLRYWGPYN
jgi:N-acetylneuraminate synthase